MAVAFDLNGDCRIADRKLLWFRQNLTRTMSSVRAAPGLRPLWQALDVLCRNLSNSKEDDYGDEELRLTNNLKLYGRAFPLIDRGAGVHVPHYLANPLRRLFETTYGEALNDESPDHLQLAFVAMDEQLNYCADDVLVPSLVVACEELSQGSDEALQGLKQLAIVGVPAGDEDDALQHALMAHEIGHIAISRSNFVVPTVDVGDARIDPESDRHLRYWPTELACDILAVHLVGPPYLFALLRRQPHDSPSDSHPSTALRALACLRAFDALAVNPFSCYVDAAICAVVGRAHDVLLEELADEFDGYAYEPHHFVNLVDATIHQVTETFGAGPGCSDVALTTGHPKDLSAVRSLLAYAPPAAHDCTVNEQTGDVVQQPEGLTAIWLAGWLVELDSSLWTEFVLPFSEAQRSQGEPQRRLGLLAAKAIEASDILQQLQ